MKIEMPQNWYTGNLTWMQDRLQYFTVYGSHAYGMAIEGSDIDLRGIFIAPKEYYYSYNKNIEQVVQSPKPNSNESDITVFEIRKYFKLAADANPNALEILFTDASDHLYKTRIGQKLLDNKELFLSQKIKHTMSGYAISQLRRIALHHRYLNNPILVEPTRKDFGLPEKTMIPHDQLEAAQAMIKKKVDEWSWHGLEDIGSDVREGILSEFERILLDITKWSWKDKNEQIEQAAINSFGFESNFLHYLDLERQYQARRKEWQSYNTWLKTRNPKRAEIEKKFGYDAKHASHLVRLLTSCREVLTTGKLNVRRPDAQHLLEIRNGKMKYEELVEWADKEDKELTELMKKSTLPHSPDHKKLERLCQELIEESLEDQHAKNEQRIVY
jgi:hypothetical protein